MQQLPGPWAHFAPVFVGVTHGDLMVYSTKKAPIAGDFSRGCWLHGIGFFTIVNEFGGTLRVWPEKTKSTRRTRTSLVNHGYWGANREGESYVRGNILKAIEVIIHVGLVICKQIHGQTAHQIIKPSLGWSDSEPGTLEHFLVLDEQQNESNTRLG